MAKYEFNPDDFKANHYCSKPVELLNYLIRTLQDESPAQSPNQHHQNAQEKPLVCDLKLFCEDNAFPSKFLSKIKTKHKAKLGGNPTFHLGKGQTTEDPRDAQEKLWIRDGLKDQTKSLMVPFLFDPTMPDVPSDNRESYKIIGVIDDLVNQKKIKDTLRGDSIADAIRALCLLVSGHSEAIDVTKLWQDKLASYRSLVQTSNSYRGEPGGPPDLGSSDEDYEKWMTNGIPEKNITEKKEIKNLFTCKKRLIVKLLACLLLDWSLAQANKLIQSAATLSGDHCEKLTFFELQTWFAGRPKDINNVIFAGLKVTWKNSETKKKNEGEFDFLSFFGRERKIVYIECKQKLTTTVAAKVHKQARKCFEYLQDNLSVTSDWTFVPVTCSTSNATFLNLCDLCSQYVCHPASLGSTLEFVKGKEVASCEDGLLDYGTLVREFNFRAKSNIAVTGHDDPHQVSLHFCHQIQSNTAEKVIFWNSHQLKALLRNPKVLIIANQTFGGGKTEVLKAKALEVAAKHPEDRVLFIVFKKRGVDLETLLSMHLNEYFKKMSKTNVVQVIEMWNDEKIAQKIAPTPNSVFPNEVEAQDPTVPTHLFIDEVYESEPILRFMRSKGLLDPAIQYQDDTPYLWVVDMEDWSKQCPELPLDLIERGLAVNMRNGEQVRETIESVQEEYRTNRWITDDVGNVCIGSIQARMDDFGGFALLLLSNQSISRNEVAKMKKELNALVWSWDTEFTDLNDSRADVNEFVQSNAGGNKGRVGQARILITSEHLAEGFECSTVFADKLIDFSMAMLHRPINHYIVLLKAFDAISLDMRKRVPQVCFFQKVAMMNQLLFPSNLDHGPYSELGPASSTIVPIIEYVKTILNIGIGVDERPQAFYDNFDRVDQDHPDWLERLNPEESNWFFIEQDFAQDKYLSLLHDRFLCAKVVLQGGSSFFVLSSGTETASKYYLLNDKSHVQIQTKPCQKKFATVEIIRQNGRRDMDPRFNLHRIEQIRHRMFKEFRAKEHRPDSAQLSPNDWKEFYLEQVQYLQENPEKASNFLVYLHQDKSNELSRLSKTCGRILRVDFAKWIDSIKDRLTQPNANSDRDKLDETLDIATQLLTLEREHFPPPWEHRTRLRSLKTKAKTLLIQFNRLWSYQKGYFGPISPPLKDQTLFKAWIRLAMVIMEDKLRATMPNHSSKLFEMFWDRLDTPGILMKKVNNSSVDPSSWATCLCHGLQPKFMADYINQQCERQVPFQAYTDFATAILWLQNRLSKPRTGNYAIPKDILARGFGADALRKPTE